MLTGLKHLTLAARDLDRSVDFYRGLLGLRLHARWDAGSLASRLAQCRAQPCAGMRCFD